MKFSFKKFGFSLMGLIFLSSFYAETKMVFQSPVTGEVSVTEEVSEENKFKIDKIDNNNSLFNLMKIVKLLQNEVVKIVLVPKLIDENFQEVVKNVKEEELELELNSFLNFQEEKFNCQEIADPTKEEKEKCISDEIIKWKKENASSWNALKKSNNLYARMKILSKEISKEAGTFRVPGEIKEKNYNEWKMQDSNSPDEEFIIQGLVLEIMNWDHQDNLNNELKEMKRKKFFEIIDTKINLLSKIEAEEKEKWEEKTKLQINSIISLKELKHKNIDEINIKDLNLDQFLGFWYIWHTEKIRNKEDLEIFFAQFNSAEEIKDPRKIKEKKWYIITLGVGGGVIFLLILNYIFWKFKR